MAETASAFTIEELTGDKRSLRFEGRTLPFKPFTLIGKQRTEITWYPGNPVASAQVLGPTEEETTINGVWKDRFIKNVDETGFPVIPQGAVYYEGATGGLSGGFGLALGAALQDVTSIVDTVDDFRRQGQLLEVSWDTRKRRGLLVGFKQTWQRREICEWEMTFQWVSQGEAPTPYAFAVAGTQTGLINQLLSLVAKLQSILENPPWAVIAAFAANVQKTMGLINEAVFAVNDAVQQGMSAAMLPAAAARSILAALQTIKDSTSDLIGMVRGQPPRAIQSTQSIDSLTNGEAIADAEYIREILAASYDLRALAAAEVDKMHRDIDQEDVLDIFTAKEATDLRDVSTDYYGTPDEWATLMAYNGLKSSALTAGTVLFIPPMQQKSAS